MPLGKYSLKLKKNKNYIDQNSPQYSLSYRVKKEDPRHASHAILSALIGCNDVIIELNTDLIDNKFEKNVQSFDRFVNYIRSSKLEYSNRNIPSKKIYSIFGFNIESNKKKELQEFLVYVPNKVWSDTSFKDFLPVCGARYYITESPMASESIVSKLPEMDEKEKKETFKLIVFDYTLIGQMGLVSDKLCREDFQKLLGCK